MLLVPIDVDVGHKDASYAGDKDSRQANVENHSTVLPALRPSVRPPAPLIGGDEDFVEDDEEEEPGGDDLWSSGQDMSLSGWEDVNRFDTQQAEIEEAVHLASIGEADVHDSNPTSVATASSPAFSSGYIFQGLRGRWHATNVVRQGLVPGTLYLFDDILVFQASSSAEANSNSNRGASSVCLAQFAGQTWRWRLERLTQVTIF